MKFTRMLPPRVRDYLSATLGPRSPTLSSFAHVFNPPSPLRYVARQIHVQYPYHLRNVTIFVIHALRIPSFDLGIGHFVLYDKSGTPGRKLKSGRVGLGWLLEATPCVKNERSVEAFVTFRENELIGLRIRTAVSLGSMTTRGEA